MPLSLCSADGPMRKTTKSDLAKQVLSLQNSSPKPKIGRSTLVLAVDIMALIRTMAPIPSTFEEIAVEMMSYIPIYYTRVDLVTDCYFPVSVKDAEKAWSW